MTDERLRRLARAVREGAPGARAALEREKRRRGLPTLRGALRLAKRGLGIGKRTEREHIRGMADAAWAILRDAGMDDDSASEAILLHD